MAQASGMDFVSPVFSVALNGQKLPDDKAIYLKSAYYSDDVRGLSMAEMKIGIWDTTANSFVNIDDGSFDDTPQVLRSAVNEDSRFYWIRFSRNFGLQAALTAGLNEVEADALVFMDADLQDPPEVIPEMVSRWHNGVEVVLAERRSRAETGLRGIMIKGFHILLPHFTGKLNMRNSGNFGLLSNKALLAMRQLPERNRYYPGLRSWIGFRCEAVSYDRESRKAGSPKQTFRHLLLYYHLLESFPFSWKKFR